MSILSFCAVAGQSHLDKAIQRAKAAVASSDGKTITQYAEKTKTHAKTPKDDKSTEAFE